MNDLFGRTGRDGRGRRGGPGPDGGAAVAAPKARLSRDLSEALAAGRWNARDVILQADAATIDAVAARHGAVVKKRLKTGAVLTVPGGAAGVPQQRRRRSITSRAT